jgi:hypothetical protein
MILLLPFLLSLGVADADPGRVVAGATLGGSPDQGFVMRGSLDYGAVPHFGLTAELGNVPGYSAATMGMGLMASPLDGQWWRVSVVAFPELNLPVRMPESWGVSMPGALSSEPVPGLATGVLDTSLGVRTGLRVNWLVFWGLTFAGRADWSQPLDGSPGWAEFGGGLSIRL